MHLNHCRTYKIQLYLISKRFLCLLCGRFHNVKQLLKLPQIRRESINENVNHCIKVKTCHENKIKVEILTVPQIFLWFWFLPPFDHPCHLKSSSPFISSPEREDNLCKTQILGIRGLYIRELNRFVGQSELDSQLQT